MVARMSLPSAASEGEKAGIDLAGDPEGSHGSLADARRLAAARVALDRLAHRVIRRLRGGERRAPRRVVAPRAVEAVGRRERGAPERRVLARVGLRAHRRRRRQPEHRRRVQRFGERVELRLRRLRRRRCRRAAVAGGPRRRAARRPVGILRRRRRRRGGAQLGRRRRPHVGAGGERRERHGARDAHPVVRARVGGGGRQLERRQSRRAPPRLRLLARAADARDAILRSKEGRRIAVGGAMIATSHSSAVFGSSAASSSLSPPLPRRPDSRPERRASKSEGRPLQLTVTSDRVTGSSGPSSPSDAAPSSPRESRRLRSRWRSRARAARATACCRFDDSRLIASRSAFEGSQPGRPGTAAPTPRAGHREGVERGDAGVGGA